MHSGGLPHLTQKIQDLEEELTTLNQINDETPDAPNATELDDVYNPDFAYNTVSYNYDPESFDASERGATSDGITSGSSTPNLIFPKTGNSTNPVEGTDVGKGGFGVSAGKNSKNNGKLNSIRILNKYV